MTWSRAILDGFKANGVQTLVHVPDLVLSDLIRMAEEDEAFDVLGATREEEGVGILCGAYLGGRKGALLMQNSGLGNAANAIASLALPYQIPFLMLISHRGGLGEFNVAQVGMGQALRPMLDGLGVQHYTLERPDEIEPVLKGASKLAFSTDRPVAIILSTLLTGGKEE